MNIKTLLISIIASAPVAFVGGCATDSKHGRSLLFGQTQTLGVSAATNSANQTPEFTVGYKDHNFAVVPVTAIQANKTQTILESEVTSNDPSKPCSDRDNSGCLSTSTDAFSVLGQFEMDATSSRVGLGKFFSTGLAAQKLADGFADKLSGHSSNEGNENNGLAAPKPEKETQKKQNSVTSRR